jgi:endogenous inhibitor of DNA gyrase (YacG/DUF329 family)
VDDFDIRKYNARFLYHGLKPPKPARSVDTLKVMRKRFLLNSNKLGDIVEHLAKSPNIPQPPRHKKVEIGTIQSWLDCMNPVYDERAWKKMKFYNKWDVILNDWVYNQIKGWHGTHPNVNMTDDPHEMNCPACGSEHVQYRGWNYMIAYKTKRYQCMDCGKWSAGEKQKIEGRLLR